VTPVGCADCVEDYWGLREKRPNPGRAIVGGT